MVQVMAGTWLLVKVGGSGSPSSRVSGRRDVVVHIMITGERTLAVKRPSRR
jgi:hypothetical protein